MCQPCPGDRRLGAEGASNMKINQMLDNLVMALASTGLASANRSTGASVIIQVRVDPPMRWQPSLDNLSVMCQAAVALRNVALQRFYWKRPAIVALRDVALQRLYWKRPAIASRRCIATSLPETPCHCFETLHCNVSTGNALPSTGNSALTSPDAPPLARATVRAPGTPIPAVRAPRCHRRSG